MENFKEELVAFFGKLAWLYLVLLGLMAKFSYDILTGKRITLWQALASTGLAFFVGYMAYNICIYKGAEEQIKWAVPFASLLSEKIIMAVFSIDWKALAQDMANYFSDKLKK